MMDDSNEHTEEITFNNITPNPLVLPADHKSEQDRTNLRHLTNGQDHEYSSIVEEAQSYHLTKEEAHSFIKNVLSIPDIGERMRRDRLECLNSLIYAMRQTIPYQTIYRCSIPLEERKKSPFSLIKEHMFNKYGGTCTELQPFFKCLLDAIGFETVYFPTSVLGNPEIHVTIMVHDLIYKGSKHMADVGCVLPTFFAIPFNFEEESPIYSSSFLVYKYVRRPDGIVEWLHQSRTDKNGWFKFAELNVNNVVDISYFLKKLDHFVSDLSEEMHRVVWSSYYKKNCFLWIRGNRLRWSDGKQLLTREIESETEKKELLLKEFPMFPAKMIEQSLLLTESLSTVTNQI